MKQASALMFFHKIHRETPENKLLKNYCYCNLNKFVTILTFEWNSSISTRISLRALSRDKKDV